MAGFETIYCVGGLGGYLGADGINPIYLQILVGHSDRMWLEPHYFDKSITPIGNISVIIPESPDDPHMLLNAIIAFAPVFFEKCKTLETIKSTLRDCTRLDFHLGKKSIPKHWEILRQEAIPFYNNLNIFCGELKQLNVTKNKTN